MGLGIQRFIFGVVILAVIAIAGVQVWARTSRTPDTIGPVEGNLRPCPPDTKSCVVSGSEDPDASAPVLSCPGLVGDDLMALVRQVILDQGGVTVANEAGNWVHFVATTPFFGFRDDVEIQLQANLRFVDIRSASRLGNDDLGVNRERVLQIATDLDTACIG